MKCLHCGMDNPDNTKFCSNCGTKIEPEQIPINQHSAEQQQGQTIYQDYHYGVPQNNNQSSSKIKTAFNKHKVLYIGLIVLVALCIVSGITRGGSKQENKHTEEKTEIVYYQTSIKVDSVENLMFSTYDVVVSIDDDNQGTIKNGEFDVFELELAEGSHSISVCSAEDNSVDGYTTFVVREDSKIQFNLHSKNDEIEIEETEYVDETTTETTTETTAEATAEKETEEAEEEEIEDTNDSVNYSTNDYETAKKGQSGVYSYKSKEGDYDVYWIISFDEGYVYYFTEGNDNDTCDKVKITSGNLNDRVTITWDMDGEKTDWYMHFKYKNAPATMIVNDHLGLDTEFWTTDLDDALRIRSTKDIVNS